MVSAITIRTLLKSSTGTSKEHHGLDSKGWLVADQGYSDQCQGHAAVVKFLMII